jgi:hypothetical protein
MKSRYRILHKFKSRLSFTPIHQSVLSSRNLIMIRFIVLSSQILCRGAVSTVILIPLLIRYVKPEKGLFRKSNFEQEKRRNLRKREKFGRNSSTGWTRPCFLCSKLRASAISRGICGPKWYSFQPAQNTHRYQLSCVYVSSSGHID